MCTPCWSWSNWKLENYANAVHHVDKEGGHSYLLLLPPSMTHLLSTNVLLHCWAQWIPGIHWAVPFSHCVVWPPPEPFLLNTRFSHPCSTTNDESPTTCCPLLLYSTGIRILSKVSPFSNICNPAPPPKTSNSLSVRAATIPYEAIVPTVPIQSAWNTWHCSCAWRSRCRGTNIDGRSSLLGKVWLAWVYFDLGTILCILWRSLEEKRSIPLWFANQGGGWNEKMVQLVMKTGTVSVSGTVWNGFRSGTMSALCSWIRPSDRLG